MKLSLFTLFFFSISIGAFAEQTDLFLFKKSYRPGNVLHYAVSMDANCGLAKFSDGTSIYPYWVMGEENDQIEGLTSKEKRVYLPTVKSLNSTKNEMVFELAAISEIEEYIPNPEITVKTMKNTAGKCVALATLTVDSRDVVLKEIYNNGRFTISMSWKTNYLTITGLNTDGSAYFKKIVP
jgi:hypothetical protein